MVRMLIYIVLLCTTFMVGFVLYYTFQISTNVRSAEANELLQIHDQTVMRMQQVFNELDHTIIQLGSDFAVQRLSEGTIVRDSAEERALRAHADFLIHTQKYQIPYVTGLCLTLDHISYSVCTQSLPLLEKPLPLLQKTQRLIVPSEPETGLLKGFLTYAAPLTNRSNVTIGSVQVAVELEPMMKNIFGKLQLSNQLYEGSGTLIYSSQPQGIQEPKPVDISWNESAQEVQWKEHTIVSVKKVELPDTVWFSRIEIQQRSEASFLAAQNRTMALVAVLLLALGVTSSLLYRYYLAMPMKQLRLLMNRAEMGDFKAYWVRKSGSEWSELGESYNQMLNRLEELIRQVKREEGLKKEAELEALQYQLNPHFLYNTLNTIKWVAKMHRTPQIAEVVTSLVRLLQASLGKKGDFITIREEMELIHDYMEIQAFRYGDKINVSSDIDAASMNCLVPRMILQPLLENAIIHGIEPGAREGLISIRIWVEAERDMLICQVEDNGVGMTPTEISGEPASGGAMRERMSGIGLRHIREKINLYYGSGYSMKITGKPMQGTTVRLTMPVHQSEEG